MPSSFDWRSWTQGGTQRGARFWLQSIVGLLAVLNLVALFLYWNPPGGSRSELTAESRQLHTSIAAAGRQSLRLKNVSRQVQQGSEQAVGFEERYIFSKRQAYESILAEIQRMAQAASLAERDGQWTEEPIEGTADLSLLTNTVNFEGSYASLMHFLYQVDRSPKLLMLDTLTATPQKGGQVTAQVRFQAVIREEPSGAAGGLQ
jgi:Tfp pilus assembly protein PilO